MLLAVAVALLVVTAGCTGVLSDSESADRADQIEKVPGNADVLVHMDMAVLSDSETRQLVEGLDENAADDIEDMDEAFEEFKNETGLDLEELHQVMVFGDTAEEFDEADEMGILLDADWEVETLVEALEEDEDTTYERTEYAGENVLWEPANADEIAEPMYVGLHDGGQIVVGDRAAVTASLDVSYDGADPISGPVRDAFENAPEGHVTFAMTMPEDQADTGEMGMGLASGLQSMSGAYYTDSGDVGVETRLVFEEAQQAEDLKSMYNLVVGQYEQDLDPEAQELLDKLVLEVEDSTLVVTWESDVNELVDLLEDIEDA